MACRAVIYSEGIEKSFEVVKKTFASILKSNAVRDKSSQKKCDKNAHFKKPVGG